MSSVIQQVYNAMLSAALAKATHADGRGHSILGPVSYRQSRLCMCLSQKL